MNTPVIGILILMLLVISGYVSSSPNDEMLVIPTEIATRHVDRHVDYYEEHLARMGIERRQP